MAYANKSSFLLMNPNKLVDNKLSTRISEYSDHYGHCEYIWKVMITKNENISNISIIAHKNASFSVIKLIKGFTSDFRNKVGNIFFINSQHNSFYQILDNEEFFIYQKVSSFNSENNKLYIIK
jgi:hypothetical protein